MVLVAMMIRAGMACVGRCLWSNCCREELLPAGQDLPLHVDCRDLIALSTSSASLSVTPILA